MSALVFSKWNGQVHVAVEHGPATTEPRLGSELDRIALHPGDAIRPIDTLIILHQSDYFRACMRAQAA